MNMTSSQGAEEFFSISRLGTFIARSHWCKLSSILNYTAISNKNTS